MYIIFFLISNNFCSNNSFRMKNVILCLFCINTFIMNSKFNSVIEFTVLNKHSVDK